jgi:hypothetical protein
MEEKTALRVHFFRQEKGLQDLLRDPGRTGPAGTDE